MEPPVDIGGYKIALDQIPSLQSFKFWDTSVGTAAPISVLLNTLVKYIFPIAGILLLFLIIASGFQMMTSTGNPETMKKAQQKLVMAVVGFVIIFASYWIIQLIDAILGINVFT